jgi:hypothetical protein
MLHRSARAGVPFLPGMVLARCPAGRVPKVRYFLLFLGLTACNGEIGDPGVSGDTPPPGRIPNEPPPGGCVGEECRTLEEVPSPSSRVARLTHAQWENTIQDLFRLPERTGITVDFNADPIFGAFDTDQRRLTITAGLWRDYQRGAEEVAEIATRDPAAMDGWLPDALPASGVERRDAFIAAFGARAYRRPLSDAERTQLGALFDLGATHFGTLDPFVAGVRITLEAMLQSPQFLYRVESAAVAADGLIALSDYELASKLSYFMWDTMPDDELSAAAAAGGLADPATLRAQAERMFDDDRTRAKLAHFHDQLLEIDRWTDTDHTVEGWRPELAPMMVQETRLFLDDVVFNGGTISDLLLSNVAFVNEDLANIYGVSGVSGSEYRRVELDASERAGLLTRVGFLTKHATLTEPDPIHRGVYINNRILCREVQAPPVIPDDLMPRGDTNRERIDSITGPGTCGASCHGTMINPIGFAFEGYDAIGRWRTEDNGQPIDAVSSYTTADGQVLDYDGAVELSRDIAAIDAPHSCYATRLLEFGYGRRAADGDSPLVFRAADGSLAGELTVRDIVIELVASRAFRYRSTEELDETAPEGM